MKMGSTRPRIAVTRGARAVTSYRLALETAGADVVEIGPGARQPEALLQDLDGLLLPGGPDIAPQLYGESTTHRSVEVDPERDALELPLVRAALVRGMPILGVCRGIQTLNVAAGGTLWQDLPSQRPSRVVHKEPLEGRNRRQLLHAVVVEPSAHLRVILGGGTQMVNSIHHQAVRDPAAGFVPVAAAPDGTIEAIEAIHHAFVLGVQWHPEELCDDPAEARLFAALCAAALRQTHTD